MAYTGEIRYFGCDYAPSNWALCDGQELPIMQNDILYCILSDRYGGTYTGDFNTSTFCLPNLQGKTPVHQGPGHWMGSTSPTSYADLTPSAGQAPVAGNTVLSACICLDGDFPSRF